MTGRTPSARFVHPGGQVSCQASEVHPLRLPTLRPADWVQESLLRRRAVLLAQYYTIRAAGWLAGMTALDRRRDRASCARQCLALVDAARTLLAEDDPLRTHLTVFGLGYRLRYEITRGTPAPYYPRLADAVDRMIERTRVDEPGRAAVLELLEMVLYDLNNARRAAVWHRIDQPRIELLTADMHRWWRVARELRDELLDDERERTYLPDTARSAGNRGRTPTRVRVGCARNPGDTEPRRAGHRRADRHHDRVT